MWSVLFSCVYYVYYVMQVKQLWFGQNSILRFSNILQGYVARLSWVQPFLAIPPRRWIHTKLSKELFPVTNGFRRLLTHQEGVSYINIFRRLILLIRFMHSVSAFSGSNRPKPMILEILVIYSDMSMPPLIYLFIFFQVKTKRSLLISWQRTTHPTSLTKTSQLSSQRNFTIRSSGRPCSQPQGRTMWC